MSEAQTDAAPTLTSISSGPGFGIARSRTSTAPGSPRSFITAFTWLPPKWYRGPDHGLRRRPWQAVGRGLVPRRGWRAAGDKPPPYDSRPDRWTVYRAAA